MATQSSSNENDRLKFVVYGPPSTSTPTPQNSGVTPVLPWPEAKRVRNETPCSRCIRAHSKCDISPPFNVQLCRNCYSSGLRACPPANAPSGTQFQQSHNSAFPASSTGRAQSNFISNSSTTMAAVQQQQHAQQRQMGGQFGISQSAHNPNTASASSSVYHTQAGYHFPGSSEFRYNQDVNIPTSQPPSSGNSELARWNQDNRS